ncbi:substrate-binding periplasmic protein [Roseateles sp. DC23W]|uniref:Substrate-binding periplasmic protein n=2 Tax=Pelomonas dachongensis TaxID=3299029 RepID=A0ABW7EPU2_9BURK
MNARTRSGWWLMGWLVAASAQAACTRAVNVPLAPIGRSVSFDGGKAQGIYPTLLREVSAASQCQMDLRKVPRARLQTMFDAGQADILIPASATPARDATAEFVPLIQVRVSLLTLDGDAPVPRSLAEMLAQPDYKLAVVRGFSFGAAYDEAIAALRQRNRLIEEPDPSGVTRALRQGLAHGTVMAASILVGTLVNEPELTPLLKRLRVEPLDEMAWSASGLYLSRRSLDEAERRTLRTAFVHVARSGRVWQLFNDHHPPGSLGVSIRPLPP